MVDLALGILRGVKLLGEFCRDVYSFAKESVSIHSGARSDRCFPSAYMQVGGQPAHP
jgi:hypothetical protein